MASGELEEELEGGEVVAGGSGIPVTGAGVVEGEEIGVASVGDVVAAEGDKEFEAVLEREGFFESSIE